MIQLFYVSFPRCLRPKSEDLLQHFIHRFFSVAFLVSNSAALSLSIESPICVFAAIQVPSQLYPSLKIGFIAVSVYSAVSLPFSSSNWADKSEFSFALFSIAASSMLILHVIKNNPNTNSSNAALKLNLYAFFQLEAMICFAMRAPIILPGYFTTISFKTPTFHKFLLVSRHYTLTSLKTKDTV